VESCAQTGGEIGELHGGIVVERVASCRLEVVS
jgi:hypothetical protein